MLNEKAARSAAVKNGADRPNRSASGYDVRAAKNDEPFPARRPTAREMPRFDEENSRTMIVSCTTARGFMPRPKMKNPRVIMLIA